MMTREELINYVLDAELEEFDTVRQVVREWGSAHPSDEEPENLLYYLACSEEPIRRSRAELRAIQDKIQNCGPACLTREEVARFGLASRGIEGVAQAREVLFAWERAHPDVPRMYEVFEQLYMMEDAARGMAEEEEAARSEASPQPLAA